jgi:hypothetical protein
MGQVREDNQSKNIKRIGSRESLPNGRPA